MADFGGGSDLLNLSTLNRDQVKIVWADGNDSDNNLDMLIVSQIGGAMYFYNYFDNKDVASRGVGHIEIIKFKNVTYNSFPGLSPG